MQELTASLCSSHGRSGTRKRLDRISNLPDEVIHQIFHFLPIRNVVCTCILSKRWRYIWTSMPDLVFRGHEMGTNTVEFTDKVLFLHDSNINNFEIHKCSGCAHSDFDRWILFFSGKNLQGLFLRFEPSDSPYAVPASFLCYQRLQYLEFESCVLDLPLEFKILSYLTHLNLRRVNMRDKTLERLLVHAPALRQLGISRCRDISSFRIHAPQLDCIQITGFCKSLDFQKAPNIKTAKFDIWDPEADSRSGSRLDTILTARGSSVRTLEIFRPLLEPLSMVTVLLKSDETCDHLNEIKLHVNFESSRQNMAVFYLITNSPNLKRLTFWARHYAKKQGKYFWKVTLSKECNTLCKECDVFSQLRYVNFVAFEGRRNEMGMMQFILLNAPVLATMGINWAENVFVDDKMRVQEDMMKFQRASSTAEIIFKGVEDFPAFGGCYLEI